MPDLTTRQVRRSLLVILLGAVMAACGGGTSTDETATTTTSSSTTSSTSTTTATTPPPTAAPATTTTVPDITCRVSQLDAQLTNAQAGAGQRYVTLVFTNHSTSSCTMFGFIGMQLIGMSGPLPTNAVRNTTQPKTLITIVPGSQAFTVLHWGAMPGPGEPQDTQCEPTPQQVRITPPNETQFLVESWGFGEVCEHGQIDTNPMQLGSGM